MAAPSPETMDLVASPTSVCSVEACHQLFHEAGERTDTRHGRGGHLEHPAKLKDIKGNQTLDSSDFSNGAQALPGWETTRRGA